MPLCVPSRIKKPFRFISKGFSAEEEGTKPSHGFLLAGDIDDETCLKYHAFYGFMGYFYVGNAHSQNGYTTGLIDIFTKPVIKLSSKVKLITTFHHFLSPARIYSTSELNLTNSGKAKSDLGTEIDLVLNVDLYSSVNLKIGYSQLFATELYKLLKLEGVQSSITGPG